MTRVKLKLKAKESWLETYAVVDAVDKVKQFLRTVLVRLRTTGDPLGASFQLLTIVLTMLILTAFLLQSILRILECISQTIYQSINNHAAEHSVNCLANQSIAKELFSKSNKLI